MPLLFLRGVFFCGYIDTIPYFCFVSEQEQNKYLVLLLRLLQPGVGIFLLKSIRKHINIKSSPDKIGGF